MEAGEAGRQPPAAPEEVEALREQLARLTEEREQWLEEKARLSEENDTLRSRCQKLARAATQAARADAETQTEADALDAAPCDASAVPSKVGGRLPKEVDLMLRSPQDEAVQREGIEALFEQHAQVQGSIPAAALQGALEAALGIFGNHPGNHALLLKVCQFLSVLLQEPSTQQQLPVAVLFQAAQAVLAVTVQLLADIAAAGSVEALAAQARAGQGGRRAASPTKLLTWFLQLLALLFSCLGSQLRDRAQSEAFIQDLLSNVVGRLLASAEVLPPEDVGKIMDKCVRLLPLLPMEPWIQKVCIESGAVHSLALAYHRCMSGSVRGESMHGETAKDITSAVRGVFADSVELCVRAVSDSFVSDEFVCLVALDELQDMEKKQRGTLLALDRDWGIAGKALALWDFHQPRALEDPEPSRSASREVLRKVAELVAAVLLKLQPQVLLQRMQEFRDADVLQRLALAAIHSSDKLRMQLAVNYVSNNVDIVMVDCMKALLKRYEHEGPSAAAPPAPEVEAAFRLLGDPQFPGDGWPYVLYCLDVFKHILEHWGAKKLSSPPEEAGVFTRIPTAAPIKLAQTGLVDELVKLIDPRAMSLELSPKPPAAVVQKANEIIQALFEHSFFVCIICMKTFREVKQIVSFGCDCLLAQRAAPGNARASLQEAVEVLVQAFEQFAASDDRLGRRILKALSALFESSYHVVAWFLKEHPLSALGEYGSVDVHVEAVRAVSRAPYWSAEDAPLLPTFVGLIAQLLLDSIEGLGDEPSLAPRPAGRVVDLTDAEQVVTACMASVLHLLLIDPSPPTVLQCLSHHLSRYGEAGKAPADDPPKLEDGGDDPGVGSEQAVNAVMRVMQVFPSSDHVQMNCQHLLTSLLGE